MNYKKIHTVYFSPTHTSQKIARAVARGVGLNVNVEVDLTCDFDTSDIEIKDSVVVIAVPVYAGRVAPTALQRVKRLKGENTPAILVVVYGNRDYEDALLELKDTVVSNGFVPLSGGAFVGEHSYSRKGMPIAEGRPDLDDIAKAKAFGCDSSDKLNGVKIAGDISSFYIKGNSPYKQNSPSTPAAPATDADKCNVCGQCIDICPTGAIFINNAGAIDTDINGCIKCCVCVKECPAEARTFDTPYTAMLHKNFSARKEPELFF